MILELFIVLIGTPLVVITLITILNALTFPRLKPDQRGDANLPRVSVLIPARNESAVIGATMRALLAQTHPDYEILLLDDQSTDSTGETALQAAQGDARLKILDGQPLPKGWGGKNWACHQLSQQAAGEILLFTDADVEWSPNALETLIRHMQATHADALTVWPTQRTETWGERLVVPLMSMVIIGYLPVLATHRLPLAAFGAANGQCLVFRRAAYQTIGGHAAVKSEIVEDIRLAQRVKAYGLRLRVADGAGLIGCRMYRGWEQVRDGYAKNILAGYGGSFLFLTFGAIFHWALFLLPLVWLLMGWLAPTPLYPAAPLLLTLLGMGVRVLSAAVTRQRLFPDALLLPISVLLMTRIAAQSVYWHWRYGGVRWKERTLSSEAKA